MTPRYHLDANVVLRFLRDDDPQQSPASARLFAAARAGRMQLLLSPVTVAEVFYVLVKVYRLSRSDAAGKLLPLIHGDVVEVEHRPRLADALQRVAKANVDFGDGYLAAAAAERSTRIASFDDDLRVFADVTTEVPQ
ncbi:MAG: PIN domain-containing protein [Opitutaceae bacterium]|nr:PIN domain-containing protein [Opitutaceae bacterium]